MRRRKTETDRDGDSNAGKKGVSVSYLQRPCSSAPGFSYFSSCCAQDTLPTQNVSTGHPGNETQQSAIFVVHIQTAKTNPTDSAVCIFLLIWFSWLCTEMSFRGILFTFILCVHFGACTLILLLEWRGWISTSAFTRVSFIFHFFVSVLDLNKKMCGLLPRLPPLEALTLGTPG